MVNTGHKQLTFRQFLCIPLLDDICKQSISLISYMYTPKYLLTPIQNFDGSKQETGSS